MKTIIIAILISAFVLSMVNLTKAQLLCAGNNHFTILGNARMICNSKAAAPVADYKATAFDYLDLKVAASKQNTNIWSIAFATKVNERLLKQMQKISRLNMTLAHLLILKKQNKF